MRWLSGVRARLWLLLRGRSVEARMEDEFRFHLEMETEANLRKGMSPAEARRRALVEFGGVDRHRESVRDERGGRWAHDLGSDVRYAWRSWRKSPGFAALAIATLALGIGANSAVFGVVKSVLLDSLPYADADRLAGIQTRFDSDAGSPSSTSPGAALDLEERLRSFSAITHYRFGTLDLTVQAEAGPRVVPATLVAGNFFSTLGVTAALGRTLTEADVGVPVVVLSDGAWRRELAADPAAVGRTLTINGNPYEVVGVLPRGFVGPQGPADLWLALDLTPVLADPVGARDQHWLDMVGRLAPGAEVETANRELAAVAAALTREHPATDRGRTFLAVPLREALAGDTRTPLLILMASAGLVLLITCANLAGALLSRTISRRKELAVRVAMGASRGRMLRQLLTESTLLAVAGAGLGLLLARAGLAALRTLPIPALPPYADLTLDGGAVAVTALAALATGVAFGLAPSLAASRWSPQGTLREESRGSSESRRSQRMRGGLVAMQIAVSLTLLAGAGLLGRSLWTLVNAPLGFDPRGVLVGRVQLGSADYPTAESRTAFFLELEERLRGVAGVEAVASASQLPAPGMSRNALTVEGVTVEGDPPVFIPYMTVTDGYRDAMGIRLLEGRWFGPQDDADAPPAIVVSETMARRYWPGGDAVGSRLRVSPHTAERWGTVVGVVGDVMIDPAQPGPTAMAYAPARQDQYWSGRDFVVRTQGDPLALVGPVQRELTALDPELPLRHPARLRDLLRDGLADRRLPVLLIGAFGILALVLASIGVYALFTTMAAAREREFGVRIALGSTRGEIAALVLRQGGAWMAAGLVGGVAGILAAGRALRGLLYGIPPFDPLALAVAVALLVTCAAVALLVPVRRATRADPIEVLR